MNYKILRIYYESQEFFISTSHSATDLFHLPRFFWSIVLGNSLSSLSKNWMPEIEIYLLKYFQFLTNKFGGFTKMILGTVWTRTNIVGTVPGSILWDKSFEKIFGTDNPIPYPSLVPNGILNTLIFSFGTWEHFWMSCDFSASPSSSKIRPLWFP